MDAPPQPLREGARVEGAGGAAPPRTPLELGSCDQYNIEILTISA